MGEAKRRKKLDPSWGKKPKLEPIKITCTQHDNRVVIQMTKPNKYNTIADGVDAHKSVQKLISILVKGFKEQIVEPGRGYFGLTQGADWIVLEVIGPDADAEYARLAAGVLRERIVQSFVGVIPFDTSDTHDLDTKRR